MGVEMFLEYGRHKFQFGSNGFGQMLKVIIDSINSDGKLKNLPGSMIPTVSVDNAGIQGNRVAISYNVTMSQRTYIFIVTTEIIIDDCFPSY